MPSYLNGKHHNGQRSSYIDVQFKVVDYRRVTALWKHKDVTLSRESIGCKLAELQRQLKQHHDFNRGAEQWLARMSGKQSLQPRCLLMRALCVNEHRHTRTMWTPRVVLLVWKTTGGEGSENLFLSAFTVITFHSKPFLTHMEAGMWVCVSEAQLIFTLSYIYYPLYCMPHKNRHSQFLAAHTKTIQHRHVLLSAHNIT